MAWRRTGDKPLSEPRMESLLTHICVTRPQWVNTLNADPVYVQGTIFTTFVPAHASGIIMHCYIRFFDSYKLLRTIFFVQLTLAEITIEISRNLGAPRVLKPYCAWLLYCRLRTWPVRFKLSIDRNHIVTHLWRKHLLNKHTGFVICFIHAANMGPYVMKNATASSHGVGSISNSGYGRWCQTSILHGILLGTRLRPKHIGIAWSLLWLMMPWLPLSPYPSPSTAMICP